MTWTPPEADDIYYASLPWPETQALFGKPPGPATTVATCGWHGTTADPNLGAYALVRTAGPLVDLVGERVRISRTDKEHAVYVYVLGQAQVIEDISLTRRAYAGLAGLWVEELAVVIEVLND